MLILASCSKFPEPLEAVPSTPSPTFTPASSNALTGAMPAAHLLLRQPCPWQPILCPYMLLPHPLTMSWCGHKTATHSCTRLWTGIARLSLSFRAEQRHPAAHQKQGAGLRKDSAPHPCLSRLAVSPLRYLESSSEQTIRPHPPTLRPCTPDGGIFVDMCYMSLARDTNSQACTWCSSQHYWL